MKKTGMFVCIGMMLFGCFLFIHVGESRGGTPVGEITSMEGNVDITSPGSAARPARVGDGVAEQDVVRAKSGSLAEIRFQDGSIVRIAPETRIKISSYVIRDDGSSGEFQLFRGKIRSILKKGLAGLFGRGKKNRYEVKTRTAVVGVRGTDFFTYYKQGVSGAIFREGEGYAFNVNHPDKVMTIEAGQAMLIQSFESLPVIRSVSPMEIELNVKETSETGTKGGSETVSEESADSTFFSTPGKNGTASKSGAVGKDGETAAAFFMAGMMGNAFVDEREFFKEASYGIDIASFDEGEDFFYSLASDADGNVGVQDPATGEFISLVEGAGISQEDLNEHVEESWDMYVGNTPGSFFQDGVSGGEIYAAPIVREDTTFVDQGIGVSSLYISGAYSEFDGAVFDDWAMNLEFREQDAVRFLGISGSKWSDETIEASAVSAWVSVRDFETGIGGGKLQGTYNPDDGTWQATSRWTSMETSRFLEMAASDATTLASLNIPSVEIGRANLQGTSSASDFSVNMDDVIFFSHSTGGNPSIWATGNISGTFGSAQEKGTVVPISGNGLSADFKVQAWTDANWAATIESGSGPLDRTDVSGSTVNIGFQGGAAGSVDANAGTFSGAGVGTAWKSE